jgi:hypothetical protein
VTADASGVKAVGARRVDQPSQVDVGEARAVRKPWTTAARRCRWPAPLGTPHRGHGDRPSGSPRGNIQGRRTRVHGVNSSSQLRRGDRVLRSMADQDLLQRARAEIRARVKELEPLVKEHGRLQSALKALEASDQPASTRRQRSAGGRQRRTPARRAGRGKRREQLLELLGADPGLRPAEAAHRMSINPSQLHSLAKRLEEEGSVQRQEGRLYLSGRS